jgi:3-polyprenyl-4-hydroxybenzoate decarboxylase
MVEGWGGVRVQMNFPEIGDLALPAEGVFHNLVFVSIRKTYPMQAYKIMHGLWDMGQMMFTKYIVVLDDDVDVHNTSEVLFRLCANTDPQRDSIFTKGPADVLDHATSEIAIGTKLGIDATHKLAGEGFKRPWPPLIKMDETVRKKIDALCNRRNGSTRAYACRFRRPRRNHVRTTPISVREALTDAREGARALPTAPTPTRNALAAPEAQRRRDSIFTKGPADVLDQATSEIASGSKLGIDATKKIPGEGGNNL